MPWIPAGIAVPDRIFVEAVAAALPPGFLKLAYWRKEAWTAVRKILAPDGNTDVNRSRPGAARAARWQARKTFKRP